MIDDIEPIAIQFQIPATDPLGRQGVMGKIRFLAEHVELNWRLNDNVFRGDATELKTIILPYGEIEHAELHKRWFKYRSITLRVGNPSLINEIPAAEVGKMVLEIDERSQSQAQRLVNYIDFKRSIFILDEQTKRLSGAME